MWVLINVLREVVLLLQYPSMFIAGVLGIKIKIMLPWDPTGKIGPKKPLPDHVSIVEPKDEQRIEAPYSEQKGGKPTADVQPGATPVAPEPRVMS